jgi:hypothetical protein
MPLHETSKAPRTSPWFVRSVAQVEGVRKIFILGSITTERQKPKDIDSLVMVENSADLRPLARLGRKLKGEPGVQVEAQTSS